MQGSCGPVIAGAASGDQPGEVLRFLADGMDAGRSAALCTLVGVDGTASRGVGAQMGILSDGSYVGSLSGGCVEGVVAAEAQLAMARQESLDLRLGAGSPFFDIRLPCGSGLDIRINPLGEPGLLRGGLKRLADRGSFALALGRWQVRIAEEGLRGWVAGDFVRSYVPPTRLVVAGSGIEALAFTQLAAAAGFEVDLYSTRDPETTPLSAFRRLTTPSSIPPIGVDRWTAVIVLFHDLDWDVPILKSLLASDAFYIGALGSRRTHEARLARLAAEGVPESQLRQLKSPIGLFPSSRDARMLSISILADVAQAEARLA